MTSRRFGGAYSPGRGAEDRGDADGGPRLTPAATPPPARPGFWARAMWIAPAPLLFAVVGDILRGAPMELAVELAAFALLLFAAWLLGEGVKAEAAYDARATARRPAFPRKILASVVTGAGVALAAVAGWGIGLAPGLLYGVLAAGAHLFAFGPDPLRDKGLDAYDAADVHRASEALEKAEAIVAETLAASRRLGDRALATRVEALCAQARAVLRQIEQDPRDLRRARRFLSVHLTGARDATVKYARLGVRDPALHDAYSRLLGDLEKSFAAHRDRLAEDDRVDLEVEIEVLQDRLKQEGLG